MIKLSKQLFLIAFAAIFFISCKKEKTKVDILITNATVFDGTGSEPISNASVTIKDGKIVAVQKGNITDVEATKTIDAGGQFVMPGLINAHLHLFWNMYDMPPKMPATSDEQAKKFIEGELTSRLKGHLEQGITSILSPIDFEPYIYNVRDKVAKGEITGPRIFAAGPVLLKSGDYYACADLTGKDLEWCNQHVRLSIDTPEEARKSVKKLVEQKADVVVYDGVTNQTTFNKEVLTAIVDEAHKNNLKIFVHNADTKDVPDMVATGVDVFIHPPAKTKDTDGRYLNIIGQKKLPIAVTLGFMQRYMKLGFASEKDKNDYDIMQNNVQVLLKAGAVPLFTSDVPGIPPAEVVPMVTGVMAGQGIDNKTILLSATKEGGKALGAKDLGTLEPGKIADVILIDGNPLKQIVDLQKVKTVIKDGKVVVEK